MNKVMVMSVIFILYMDMVCVKTIEDFFTDTWNSIKAKGNELLVAIKRPVKPRRLGSIGRRKTKRTTTTSTTKNSEEEDASGSPVDVRISTTKMYRARTVWFPLSTSEKPVPIVIQPEIKRITFPEGFPDRTPSGDSRRVKLPYLTQPPWRSIEEWQRMQRAHFVKYITDTLKKENEGKVDGEFEALVSKTNKLADMKEEERFGVLIFV